MTDEMREQNVADAEFIIEACDGECYCDPAMIAEGHGPCAICQCIATAEAIKNRNKSTEREASK